MFSVATLARAWEILRPSTFWRTWLPVLGLRGLAILGRGFFGGLHRLVVQQQIVRRLGQALDQLVPPRAVAAGHLGQARLLQRLEDAAVVQRQGPQRVAQGADLP